MEVVAVALLFVDAVLAVLEVPEEVASVLEDGASTTISLIVPLCVVQVFLSLFLYQPTPVEVQFLVASKPVSVQ